MKGKKTREVEKSRENREAPNILGNEKMYQQRQEKQVRTSPLLSSIERGGVFRFVNFLNGSLSQCQ